MSKLALTTYLWGLEPQNHFLAACLGPLCRELRGAGVLRHLWFDRFDARGPHVFAVLTAREGARDVLAARVDDALRAYLASSPSRVELSEAELAERHAGCGGKTLCDADRLPGFAENNTHSLLDHHDLAYPFTVTAGRSDADEVWSLLDGLADWSIEQVAEDPSTPCTVAATAWLAGLDLALRRAGLDAVSLWRHCACKVVPGLRARLGQDEPGTLENASRAIPDKTADLLGRTFAVVERCGGPWSDVDELVRLAGTTGDLDEDGRWVLLREVTQGVLKQLGLFVRQHRLLFLYGLTRGFDSTAAVRESPR